MNFQLYLWNPCDWPSICQVLHFMYLDCFLECLISLSRFQFCPVYYSGRQLVNASTVSEKSYFNEALKRTVYIVKAMSNICVRTFYIALYVQHTDLVHVLVMVVESFTFMSANFCGVLIKSFHGTNVVGIDGLCNNQCDDNRSISYVLFVRLLSWGNDESCYHIYFLLLHSQRCSKNMRILKTIQIYCRKCQNNMTVINPILLNWRCLFVIFCCLPACDSAICLYIVPYKRY